LADYNEEFIGLSGDPEQIAQLEDELYVGYGDMIESEDGTSHEHEGSTPVSHDTPDSYRIAHNAHIAVINPQGDYHAVMRAPHRDQDLIKAFREIVR